MSEPQIRTPKNVDLFLRLEVRPYRPADEAALLALWERCDLVVPHNDPRSDIANKLAFQPELFLVGVLGGEIVGSVMAGYEGHRGWINYLAVDPGHRSLKLGRRLMEAAETALRRLGCPKVNLQIRAGNHEVIAFYETLGYTVEDRIGMGKRLA